MNIAVVGGRGWLGQAIVRTARAAGHEVRVVSRRPGPGVVAADPASPLGLTRALEGVDLVVSAAGYRGDDATAAHEVNVALPRRLGRLAFTEGWRLVHLGSAGEYGRPVAGDGGSADIAEDHPCQPSTLYGRSKLAGTGALLEWRTAGAAVVVVRVFNVADAELPADNPLRDLVAQVRGAASLACGEPGVSIPVGDPTTVRDISSRTWVATAVVALATSPRGIQHPVVNVCSGFGTSFGELARTLAAHLDLDVAVHDLGWPRGGRIVGDPARLRSLVDLPVAASAGDHLHELVTSIFEPLTSQGGEQQCHFA